MEPLVHDIRRKHKTFEDLIESLNQLVRRETDLNRLESEGESLNSEGRGLASEIQVLIQQVLGQCQDNKEFAGARRLQLIHETLNRRFETSVGVYRNNMNERRHEDILKAAASTSQDDSRILILNQEKNVLDTSLDLIQTSVLTAKITYNALLSQGTNLQGVGKRASEAASQLMDIHNIIYRIKNVKFKQQIILLSCFIVCVVLTLVAIAKNFHND